MARPRPEPPASRERASSRRVKRWKTRVRSAAGIPDPVVADGEFDGAAAFAQGHPDLLFGMAAGVVQQIAYDAAQRLGVAPYPPARDPPGVDVRPGQGALPADLGQHHLVQVDDARSL